MAIVLRLKEASTLLSQGKYDHVLSILHEIRGLVGVDRYHAKKVLRDGFSREMKEPHPLSPLRLAMEHLRASDKDKACDVLKRAMEPMEECRQMRYYDPTVSDMLVMFGKVYITLGFGEEGQHFHRQALRGAYHYSLLHPSACSDSRVREMLRLLDLPGDTDIPDLLESFSTSAMADWPWTTLVPDPRVREYVRLAGEHLGKAACTGESGWLANVYVYLHKALDLVTSSNGWRMHDPMVTHIIDGIATVHIRAGRVDKAIQWLRRSLESAYHAQRLQPDLATRTYKVAMLCRQLGQVYLTTSCKDAIRLLYVVSQLWPGDHRTLLYISYAYSKTGLQELSRMCFHAYLQNRDPKASTPYDSKKEVEVRDMLSRVD